MESLPFLVKTGLRVEKLRVAMQTRNTHLSRNGRKDTTTIELEECLRNLEDYMNKIIAEKLEVHPAQNW